MSQYIACPCIAKHCWNWTTGMGKIPHLRTMCSNTSTRRLNAVDIQMLSKSLHDQLFQSVSPEFDQKAIKKSREHLEKHGLWGKSGTILPDISFQLPTLYGSNVDEHFCEIAREQSKSYFEKAQMLSERSLPQMPERWSFNQGWTKYESTEHSIIESTVDYPEDDALLLDVEVCLSAGSFPTIAVAASPHAWYSWVSPQLLEERSYQWLARPTPDLFVPLESKNGEDMGEIKWKERLVIGHNVGYDRSCLKEQYYIKGSKSRFLDTLSLHMCVSGLSRSQRGQWESAIKNKKEKAPWMLVGSGNKLQDVHQLYCEGEQLNKALVKVFVEGTMEDVRAQFQELTTYCAKDVAATHEVFCGVWPQFLQRFPHPVTFAGMLEMGTAYLPVDQSWENYLRDADDAFDDLENEVKKSLMKLANDCCRYLHHKCYTEDPWLWSLDWSVQDLRVKKLKPPKKRKRKTSDEDDNKETKETKQSREKNTKKVNNDEKANGQQETPSLNEQSVLSPIDQELDEEDLLEPEGAEYKRKNSLALIPRAEDVLYKRRQHMPGYPKWYRNLCMKVNSEDFHPGPVLLSPSCQIAPLLLRMTWDGFPLYYSQKHGWGYLVPGRRDNIVPYEQENLEGIIDKEMVESDSPDNPFPTKSFEELLRNYEKRKQFEETLGTLREEDIEWIRSITKEESWLETEFDENKQLKKSISQLLKQETDSLLDENSSGNTNNTPPREGILPVKRKNSRPGFYHGVGPYNDVDLPGVWFFRVPHKNGEGSRCGNPLAQDYLSKIQDGTLVSIGDKNAHQTLVQSRMTGNWKSIKSRVKQQLVVWLDNDEMRREMRSTKVDKEVKRGAILPKIISAGTVTRRAVETTWLVATNPRENLVGSELKAMVRAPPGYYLIGADVDSQELWIAAVLGDAQYTGIHGSTALGWMTLQGKKSEGTDLHSKTAQTVGISRDHAKVFNYGRIYGAGQKFAEKLLQQFNHRLTEREAREKAELLYASTKGKTRYKLTSNGIKMAEKYGYTDRVDEKNFVDTRTYYELLRRSKRTRKSGDSISEGKRWLGGSESEMFNKLEQIAQSDEPSTPVLGCRISKALEPRVVGNEFLMSRVNWVVQSSAVDYLHLMLVCMRWLFTKYNIDGRFCISIHDEVRYLVNEKDKYRAALALQITNLLTRAMFAYKLNMNDLPQSVAFFSAVDIDKVLRKEVHLDCKTPSNPMGLQKGHRIPPGEALDIYQILERTNNGCLSLSDGEQIFQKSNLVTGNL